MSKIGSIIADFATIWPEFQAMNRKACDESASVEGRYFAAKRCEAVIGKRYELMRKADEYFEGKLKQ